MRVEDKACVNQWVHPVENMRWPNVTTPTFIVTHVSYQTCRSHFLLLTFTCESLMVLNSEIECCWSFLLLLLLPTPFLSCFPEAHWDWTGSLPFLSAWRSCSSPLSLCLVSCFTRLSGFSLFSLMETFHPTLTWMNSLFCLQIPSVTFWKLNPQGGKMWKRFLGFLPVKLIWKHFLTLPVGPAYCLRFRRWKVPLCGAFRERVGMSLPADVGSLPVSMHVLFVSFDWWKECGKRWSNTETSEFTWNPLHLLFLLSQWCLSNGNPHVFWCGDENVCTAVVLYMLLRVWYGCKYRDQIPERLIWPLTSFGSPGLWPHCDSEVVASCAPLLVLHPDFTYSSYRT